MSWCRPYRPCRGGTAQPLATRSYEVCHDDVNAPFRLSWNVSGTTSCSQTIIVSQPLATLDVPLYSAGNYVLTMDVANDWSGCSKQVLFTVLRPDAAPSGASASIVFLCTMIGLVAVAVTFISYRRDRQLSQRHLEVADFNFHHTTPTSSVGHCVATLRHKWRHLWTLRVSRDGVPLNSYDQL
ncbi:hypothetical protein LSAT2_012323 [Lamellibrachia satsuma]|nr:hypothetical protein LSAT2_012323 [Lamellibrachia satsuma]